MTSPIRSMALVLMFASFPASNLWAQAKGKPAPEEHTGLKVGEKAPGFVLQDQWGKKRSLDEFLGKGKVALVFYRSADW
jgi:cytochrome oxidase Cu insertion factor (SCO1/SenC/PrrC family)